MEEKRLSLSLAPCGIRFARIGKHTKERRRWRTPKLNKTCTTRSAPPAPLDVSPAARTSSVNM